MSIYTGHKNLEVLSKNHRFNKWMYEQACDGLKGDVLELGSGTGTFSEKIIHNSAPNSHIVLTDISTDYIKKLEGRFLKYNDDGCRNISVYKLDLNCKEDYEQIGYGKFDSIIAINVLEHIQDDEFALQQLYNMLRKDGKLFLLVPCHKFLYNVIDKEIGHYRRYNKPDLKSKVKRTQFSIQRIFYFNILGIIGWYVNGNLIRKANISGTASQLFDKLVPLSKYIEKITGHKIGLSIICHLSKK